MCYNKTTKLKTKCNSNIQICMIRLIYYRRRSIPVLLLLVGFLPLECNASAATFALNGQEHAFDLLAFSFDVIDELLKHVVALHARDFAHCDHAAQGRSNYIVPSLGARSDFPALHLPFQNYFLKFRANCLLKFR